MGQHKQPEDWLTSKWRPAMGWMYMIVCITDFILFPVLWSVIQVWDHAGVITSQWDPLTLKGAGLFHMAMGAVLGVAAWSRGQEKMMGMNASGVNTNYNIYQEPDPYYGQARGYAPQYYNSGRVFTSRYGKQGPIIEEPEL